MKARQLLHAGLLLLGVALFVPGCKSTSNAIKEFMPPSPSEEARNMFNVYDPDIRRRAVSNLSAAPFGGEDPYLRSYRLLIDDPDPTVRAASVKALGLHGKVTDASLISVRLRDVSSVVRWEAAKALQKIHNPDAVKALIIALLDDDDADVRMASATALGQYAQNEVVSALVSALSDQEHGVVHAAMVSLQTLTGQDIGSNGMNWLTWIDQNSANLFAGRRTYTWMPYEKPRGFWDKVKFWKKRTTVTPRIPTGMDDPATSPAAAG
ncbi:MAG: HEAT repeat domain-containing protein [Phycisphaeraceae bacterium]|nr:HEAT repeat domain-containing protein [Phycisphaeraceae bacterium]